VNHVSYTQYIYPFGDEETVFLKQNITYTVNKGTFHIYVRRKMDSCK